MAGGERGHGLEVLPERVPASSTDIIFGMDHEKDPQGSQGCILCFFKGRLDAERLAKAANLTLEAEPLLRYGFVNDRDHPYWKKVEDRDLDECLEVYGGSDEGMKRFLLEVVDPSRAPQVRLGLFRSERDILCLKVNHIAVDGGGAIQYLYLLAETYRELGRDPAFRRPRGKAIRPGPRLVLREVGPLEPLKALPRLRIPAPALRIRGCGDDRSSIRIAYRQISPERLMVLRAFAKERGATINDLLVAAFARAAFSLNRTPYGEEYRFEVPVNLRRYLPPSSGMTICNLAAVYFINLDNRLETYEETLARVRARMEEAKGDGVELAEMMLLELVTIPGPFIIRNIMGRGQLATTRPTITNLGVVDEQKADFGVDLEEVRDLAPPIFPPNYMISALTYRQRMSFSLVFYPSAVPDGHMERFLDAFMDELPGKEMRSEPRAFKGA
jgi:NRPS condensation-like uncharacterized protein